MQADAGERCVVTHVGEGRELPGLCLDGAGIVETRRGGGGGAVLARPPAEIRLGDILRVLEEGQPLVECFAEDGGACSIDGRCRLKGRLARAEAAFLAELDRASLADIALPAAHPG